MKKKGAPFSRSALSSLSLNLLQLLIYFVPVHHVPPGRNVFGPAVLIFQIVRVLPDVEAQHRLLALHNRAVLVSGRNNLELPAAIFHQPRPARAEASGRSRVELLFESFEAAEI